MTPQQSLRRRTFVTKLFYGSGSLAFGIKDNGFSVLLLLYYNQVLGLPAAMAGGALALALVIDSVADPVIGYISDNTRSRLGRRHPYMYAAAVPAALSYLLLWNPPAHLGQSGLLVYLFVVTVFVRTFISLYEIPSSALGPELSEDYDERTSYMSFRFLFGWVGGVTMYILAFALFLRPDAAHPIGQLNPSGYHNYALAASAIMFVSILLSAAGTHSAIPRLKQPPPRQRRPLRESVGEILVVLGNPSAIVLLGAGVVGGLLAGITFALSTYFTTFFWQLPSGQIAVLGTNSYLAAFGAMMLAPILSKRMGKKWALITVAIASTLLGPLAIIMRLLGVFPPPNSLWLLPVLFLTGILAVGLSIIPPILGASMMSDVVEDNEVKTGRRSEGVLFAANAFLLKCVSGSGLLGAAAILGIVHFPQHATPGHVAPDILRNLGWVYVAALCVLSAISIAFIGGYRITRARHSENLRVLAAAASEISFAEPRLFTPGPP